MSSNEDVKKDEVCLYIVPVPIGNYGDMTLRAIEVLKQVPLIICEEYREARRLLSHFGINAELASLNEHNEAEEAAALAELISGKGSAALISDCGTPVFSDPGTLLIRSCVHLGIKIITLPGANSLTTALSGSGFELDSFYFAGWLSPKKDIRRKELERLRKIREIIILMDTPYRLVQLLEAAMPVFNANPDVVLAYQLTYPDEKYFRGTMSQVLKEVSARKLKGEFVLIVDNR